MTDPATPEPAAVDASPATLTAEEIADLKAAREERDALKAKLADEKRADREARKTAQAEAEKAGELGKALEAAKARLAELEGLEPLAARWREHESAEVARLDKRAADLPAEFADLYKGASDLASKGKILAAFDAVKGAPAKQPASPIAMGAPASTAVVVDFDSAFRDPAKWVEAKGKDPKGALAWIQSRLSPQRQSDASPTFARAGAGRA